MLFVLRRNSIGADLYVICPSTLIFRYYYSIEELGVREGGGGGKKPSPKPGPKSGKNQAARPLRGAEVLGIWPDLYLYLEEIHRAGFLCY